jgi:uncharacterized protein (TIGR03437 family)
MGQLRLFLLLSTTAAAAFAQSPSIISVVNGASFAGGALAPGSVASVFGSNLASGVASPSAFPLPAYVANASVYVNGVAAPILYASPSQINFQVPWEAGLGTGSVVVIANGVPSNQVNLQIASAAPGIFDGSAFNSAYGLKSAAPLHAGEYLTILATGLGAVEMPPATGDSLADAAIAKLLSNVNVTVGGAPARVGFAGLAPPGPNPYNVGVYEIIAQVPTGITAGNKIPVSISIGAVQSNQVTLTVVGGAAQSIAKYIEIGPSSAVIARAITSEDTCPAITIDGKAATMQVRAAPSLPFYPVLSCESAVPATAQAVSIEGQAMKLPATNPQRITVLGDTGCRMDTSNSQGCYDPKAWPLAQIAASAIETNPQLLIHDGDYHYREAQCFPNVAGCQGSPWGYNWDVWREDVFKPMHDLLAAAPWVFTRGNHESCDRAGEGWFRFLEPRAMPKNTCDIYTDPYSLSIGSLQLIELDSAQADDSTPFPDQVAAYMTQFNAVRSMAASSPSWVLTHRPIWGIRSNLNANVVMQTASGNDLGNTEMILSGHTHTFQTYTFSPARAPQLVIGNSGDNLAAPLSVPIIGFVVGNASISDSTLLGGYGFSTLNPGPNGSWTITAKDVTGTTTANCSLTPLALHCN